MPTDSPLFDHLKLAIDANDVSRVESLMTRFPDLHRAPLGYGKSGPLTWAAECRVPYEAPTPERLAIAKWMLDHGSDVHQGGDGPLMRAALNGDRIPMMELLIAHGADVNALWNGDFPIIFAACETVSARSLKWLLEHGANPNCDCPNTALDYLIGSYARSEQFPECVKLLVAAGGKTRYDLPGVLDLLRGELDLLAARLDEDPALVDRRFAELDCGSTGARRLLLSGGTLLHVAAEFGDAEAARLLLDRGAAVDAPAESAAGQTPLFHAVSQSNDWGLDVARLLIERGASLSIRLTLPGHYERPDEMITCTPLEYALLFPGGESETSRLLANRSA